MTCSARARLTIVRNRVELAVSSPSDNMTITLRFPDSPQVAECVETRGRRVVQASFISVVHVAGARRKRVSIVRECRHELDSIVEDADPRLIGGQQ